MAGNGIANRLFGYLFRDPQADEKARLPSFTAPPQDDGALTIQAPTTGAAYGSFIDMEASVRTEAELVTRYRQMTLYPEVNEAITQVVNDAVVDDDEQDIVVIDWSDLEDKLDESLRKRVEDEFKTVLRLMRFDTHPYETFRSWYVDGRIYYHAIIDRDRPEEGVKEFRYVDPRKIRRVREVQTSSRGSGGAQTHRVVNEYYIYSDRGFQSKPGQVSSSTITGVKIAKDSIVHGTSGLTNETGTMVLGYLHPAIKYMNQLRAIEDAVVIYRLVRAPERRVWEIDVGNLPKAKAEAHIRDTMVRHKNRLVYDSASGAIRDDRRYMCLAMDTRVPLLDGRTPTIAEIAEERKSGKTLWAYSCDPKTGKIAPGLITWAGVTQESARVMRLTLDNGEIIVCTPDHKFPVWDKDFVRADELTVGESMIPLYRANKPISPNSKLNYERVFDGEKWIWTHRLVSNWKDEVGLDNEWTYNERYTEEKKTLVHHRNFNQRDNTPDNLTRMGCADHRLHHHDNGCQAGKKVPYLTVKSACEASGQDIYRKRIKEGAVSEARRLNHRIVKIEQLSDPIQVGTLTIDGQERYHDHHTFAVAAGIFVKNSLLDDFYLARRPDGSGNKVDVLQSGNLADRVADVEYFLKRVYKSLGVPIGRLLPEDLYTIGRTSEITREELSFSRQIIRLRRRFGDGVLAECLGRQLILTRVMSPEDWRELRHRIKYKWARDNFQAELMEREITLGRLDAVDRMMPYIGRFFSNKQLRRDVLKQDDDQIEEINDQIEKEADDPQYPPPGGESEEMPGNLMPPGPDVAGGASGSDPGAPEPMPKAPKVPAAKG